MVALRLHQCCALHIQLKLALHLLAIYSAINHFLLINQSSITKYSRPELKNVFRASSGDNTIGSPFTLNEVFKTTGMPVSFPNSVLYCRSMDFQISELSAIYLSHRNGSQPVFFHEIPDAPFNDFLHVIAKIPLFHLKDLMRLVE